MHPGYINANYLGCPEAPGDISAYNNFLTEDEALARAVHESLHGGESGKYGVRYRTYTVILFVLRTPILAID